jgi:hypothetical protein
MDSFIKHLGDFTMTTMSKTFTFPKVAYTSSRRVNLPTIEVELRDADTDKPKLSICGELWNSSHTDVVMGGQCLNDLARFDELFCNPLFRKLHRLWSMWHLNDLHPGTVKQEQALDNAEKSGVKVCSYDDQCKYLESIGLLEDDGYQFGSAWLYREIPADDLNEIVSLLSE